MSEPPSDPAKALPTLRILWAAFMASQLLLFGVLTFVVERNPGEEPIVPFALAGVALMQWAFAAFGAPVLLRKMNAQSYLLIRFALFEATTIIGSVAGIVGGPIAIPIVSLVLALVGMLMARPTLESYTAWEVRRLSD